MTVTRQEKDTFGLIDVPANKLWGAQTQRSLQNFDISGEQQPREIIAALAQVKRPPPASTRRWVCWTRKIQSHQCGRR
jgi:fumarate hydratase class II